jgi:hypothetical protein
MGQILTGPYLSLANVELITTAGVFPDYCPTLGRSLVIAGVDKK